MDLWANCQFKKVHRDELGLYISNVINRWNFCYYRHFSGFGFVNLILLNSSLRLGTSRHLICGHNSVDCRIIFNIWHISKEMYVAVRDRHFCVMLTSLLH